MIESNEQGKAFRAASRADLSAIVQLLADDELGSKRENPSIPLCAAYQLAFDAIESDPNNELMVATMKGSLVGVLQITFIP